MLEIDFIAFEEDMLHALNEKEVCNQYSEDCRQEPERKIKELKYQSSCEYTTIRVTAIMMAEVVINRLLALDP